MLYLSKKEVRSLAIAILLVSFAFTLADISVSFLIYSLVASTFAVITYKFFNELVSNIEGVESECELWVNGIGIMILSAFVSTGQAVLVLPLITTISEKETSRWKRSVYELTSRDIGVTGASGVMGNIIMSIIFLAILRVSSHTVFELGAMINLWMAFSILLPVPPLDGADIMQWRSFLWLLLMSVTVIGLLGFYIV